MMLEKSSYYVLGLKLRDPGPSPPLEFKRNEIFVPDVLGVFSV
jgi:hypothetical protein